MKNWILITLVALLAIALIVGCGGGGGPGGSTLSGRVVDGPSGLPLAGVRVALGTSTDTTGSDGAFTLAGLPTGPGLLTAQLGGYEISSVVVNIVFGRNTLQEDVLMAPITGNPPGGLPRTIQGTIALSGESDSSGVTVVLLSGGAPVEEVTTGPDGAYFFWAPKGTYTVRAAKAGFGMQEREVTVADLTVVVTADFTLLRL